MNRLCGLWLNQDKNGNQYLSGNFTYGTRLIAFPNSFKKSDKDPDYIVYLDENEKKKTEASHQAPTEVEPF